MISETSLIAFNKIKNELPACRLAVYKELDKQVYATNKMLSEGLGWAINRITGRTSELKRMGLIHVSHMSWCPCTKSKANYLTLTKYNGGI